jgi:Flp pilus assembly protein protease CpaA
MLTQKEIEMVLDSMTLVAMLIALTTSVAVITLAIRQNAILTKENMRLRRELRKSRSVDYYMPKPDSNFYDPDLVRDDLWTTK